MAGSRERRQGHCGRFADLLGDGIPDRRASRGFNVTIYPQGDSGMSYGRLVRPSTFEIVAIVGRLAQS